MNTRKKLSIFFILLTFINCSIEVDIPVDNNNTNQEPFKFPNDIQVPNLGLLGNPINIFGTDLIADSLKISFDDIDTNSFQISNDTIATIVPRELSDFNVPVKLFNINNDSLYYSGDFSLRTPEISGVETNEVRFGEYIWVYGENFDIDSDYLKSFINNEEISLGQISYDSIQIYIPNNLDSQSLDVKINAQLQEVSSDNLMALKTPTFTSSSNTTSIGNLLTLYGDNFNPSLDYSSFKINNEIDVSIEYIYNNDSLRIRIPYGPYEDFEIHSISYETAGMQTSYDNIINIDSPYIMHFKNDPASINSEVYSYNDKLYFLGTENNDNSSPPTIYLWESDLNSRTWNRIDSINFNSYSITSTMNNNGEIYVYLDSSNNGFKKINLNNLTLHNLNNIPNSQLRNSPILVVENDKVFIGKGFNPSTNSNYTDLYKFDINSNIWESVSSDLTTLRQSQIFNFQGKTYILNFVSGTLGYNLYIFDSNTNSFSLTPNFSSNTGNLFIYNNKLIYTYFLSNNEFGFYDFETNQQLLLIYNTLDSGFNHIFTVNNKVFFKSGLINNAYAPSSAFYLFNDSVTSQF